MDLVNWFTDLRISPESFGFLWFSYSFNFVPFIFLCIAAILNLVRKFFELNDGMARLTILAAHQIDGKTDIKRV